MRETKMILVIHSKKLSSFFLLALLNFLILTFFVFIFSIFPQEGHCAQVTLTWDPNSESDLAGYKIYYGTQSRNYPRIIDTGNVTTYTLNGLDLGMTYYATATAYNTQGLESGFSNEVVYAVPSCTYAISPSNAAFPASGGSGSIFVTTQAGCNWGTSASASWVTINSGSGTGTGSMSYKVSPNTEITSRMASLTIAGNVFTVTEAALPAYAISISKNGTGEGIISTNPAGTAFPAGSQVTLNAIPDVNSAFSGWSGACSRTTPTCQVTMTSNLSVSASFSALKNTPIVTINSATSVTSISATLNGTLNPYGLTTTYFFQWGPTGSYGNTMAVQSAGSVRGYIAASTTITGLTANMTYHYRLVATNSAGTTYGPDGTFFTRNTSQVDFNNDRKTDILWRHKLTGQIAVWYMNGATPTGSAVIADFPSPEWEIVGTGDFNSDGRTDILWRNITDGTIGVWYMNGATKIRYANVANFPDLNWEIVGTGDFNNDGQTDILWRHKHTGQIAVWYMNGITPTGSVVVADFPDLNWEIVGTGDFNTDGQTDILWRHKQSGQIAVWYMNGVTPTGSVVVANFPDLNWEIVGTGDFNNDGKTDILWRQKQSGQIAVWYMNGITPTGAVVVADFPYLDWVIMAP